MTETETLYNHAPVSGELQQKCKVAFSDDQGRTLHIEYNGPEHLFRIRLGAVQRLFFFDVLFQKLILHNEYGVAIGQLSAGRAGGWVRIDEKQYRFALGKNEKLSLLHAESGALALSCAITNGLHAENLDAQHRATLIHCLIFAFAWTLS